MMLLIFSDERTEALRGKPSIPGREGRVRAGLFCHHLDAVLTAISTRDPANATLPPLTLRTGCCHDYLESTKPKKPVPTTEDGHRSCVALDKLVPYTLIQVLTGSQTKAVGGMHLLSQHAER